MEAGRRQISLHVKMLIGFLVGLGTGMAAYLAAPGARWIDIVTTYVTGPIGQIFLRLLFMLVIPLVFSALVVGITQMADMRSLKRIGIRTLAVTITLSSIAVVLALLFGSFGSPMILKQDG